MVKVNIVVTAFWLAISLAPVARAETLRLPDDEREVFTSEPLEDGRWYQIIVTGTKTLSWHSQSAEADVLYTEDGDGNFRHRVPRLHHDGLRDLEIVSEDRALHRYVYRGQAEGRRLALRFSLTSGSLAPDWTLASGTVSAEITETASPPWWSQKHSLLATAIVVAGLIIVGILIVPRKAEPVALPPLRARKPAPCKPSPEEQRAQEARDLERRMPQAAYQLRFQTEGLRNWSDPDFRQKKAEKDGLAILAEAQGIRKRYADFMETRIFADYIKLHHPDLYERVIGEQETLILAERLDAQRFFNPPAPLPRLRRRKLSTDEWRDRLVRRIDTRIKDHQAVLAATLEHEQEMRETLGAEGLDEEEIQRHVNAARAQIAAVIVEAAKPKGDDHAPDEHIG